MGWVRKENVLRLQVAVDDVFRLEEHEAVEDLLGEATYEAQGEAGVVVQLDKFV